ADHLHVFAQRQQSSYAAAHQRLIVDEHDADHRAASADGSQSRMPKPRSGLFPLVILPPACSTRSRMPCSPLPSSLVVFVPIPSSSISTAMPESDRKTAIDMRSAFEWRIALLRPSWMAWKIACATGGSTTSTSSANDKTGLGAGMPAQRV